MKRNADVLLYTPSIVSDSPGLYPTYDNEILSELFLWLIEIPFSLKMASPILQDLDLRSMIHPYSGMGRGHRNRQWAQGGPDKSSASNTTLSPPVINESGLIL